MNIRIEAATTIQQWTEASAIRKQVFTEECGYTLVPLPPPGSPRAWHLIARDGCDAIGTLSIVESTGDRRLHERYRLAFEQSQRIARYCQLALLKPYRKRGAFELLLDTAEKSVVLPNRFAVVWLLYPAAYAQSSALVRRLGFNVNAPIFTTELGRCQVL